MEQDELQKEKRRTKIEYVEKIVEVEKMIEAPKQIPPYVYVDKALAIAEKGFEKRVASYIYTIWKLMFHIFTLNDEFKKMRAERIKSAASLVVREKEPLDEEFMRLLDNIAVVYNYARLSLVDLIFEIFVRSSNHAYAKKVNSLILFVINLNEAKESHKEIWLSYLETYTK